MLAALALGVWLYLCLAHGRFWQSGPELGDTLPTSFPDVDIIVPARDEAHTIAVVVASLCAQNYAGTYRVILVDDNSTDGTADRVTPHPRLAIITLREKPLGWSGKLWALSQGVAASAAPILLFTDADIVHEPKHLSSLVAKLQQSRLVMVSEMVHLHCDSLAERALIPAFIYFFQMLYPFWRVNKASSAVAAAAGGTVLIQREALNQIGGIAAIKNSLIDDVALAKKVKQVGPIYLGHSRLAASIRPYPEFADIWHMVARTAFTQLKYSSSLLLLTVVGLALVWLVPVEAMVFGSGWQSVIGGCAYLLAAATYAPTLARYRQPTWWALLLPAIALFYMAATVQSAMDYWRGRGATWKSRDYGKQP